MTAQVVLLAGPSGAGKSRLAVRSGLPILQLDDFYKEGDDPSLPRLTGGAVDWDHPASWDAEAAMAALVVLCRTGRIDVPMYDIAANARSGTQVLHLDGARCLVAEGIFAGELARPCADAGVLAAALCVRRSRCVTFVLRLTRDLREHRKPPLFLVRRGLLLARREKAIVATLVSQGCRTVTPRQAERLLADLA